MAHEKVVGVAILISDKVDFKLTLIKGDKGHSILIKGEIYQKEITIINLYAPNQCTQFQQTYSEGYKEYIDSDTLVMGDFNTPHHLEIGNPNTKSI
jgi:exonuclease III